MSNKSELPKRPVAVEKDNVVWINAGRLIPYFPAKELITGSFYSLFSLSCYKWLARMFYTSDGFRREQNPSLLYVLFC